MRRRKLALALEHASTEAEEATGIHETSLLTVKKTRKSIRELIGQLQEVKDLMKETVDTADVGPPKAVKDVKEQ